MAASLFKLIICVSLFCFINHAVHAQKHGKTLAETYAPIDVNLRPRLAARLKMFVEYYRKRQWGKLYDATYLPSLEGLREKKRDEFIKSKKLNEGPEKVWLIIGFRPYQTLASNWRGERLYSIEGCLKIKWEGGIGYAWGGIGVYLVGGEWYFTDFGIVTDYHNPPPTCNSRGLIELG